MYQIFIALLFSNNLDGSEGTKRYKQHTRHSTVILGEGRQEIHQRQSAGRKSEMFTEMWIAHIVQFDVGGMGSGVRIHGTAWCVTHLLAQLAGKVQSSVVERVLWVPGATSWSRLSGSCPKLDNTLTVEQCPLSVTPHYILCTTAPESRRQRAATGDGRGRSSPVLHRTLSKAVIRPRGPSPEL